MEKFNSLSDYRWNRFILSKLAIGIDSKSKWIVRIWKTILLHVMTILYSNIHDYGHMETGFVFGGNMFVRTNIHFTRSIPSENVIHLKSIQWPFSVASTAAHFLFIFVNLKNRKQGHIILNFFFFLIKR